MKTKVYLLLLMFSTISVAHAQWNMIDSTTLGNNNSINFMNADTGFVYNQPGIIWRTANGGHSWDSISLNFTGLIKDMSFANNSIGYAVGGAYFPHGQHYPFAIFKTIDGGLTWDSIYAGHSSGIFTHVAALSNMEFITTSQKGMIHSADGGQTYDTVSATNMLWGTEQYTRIRFLKANEGYVLGRSNSFIGNLFNLYKTTDGGQSWQSIHADSVFNFSLDFVMTPSGNGLIVGNDSYVLRTTNGGNSWQKVAMANSNIIIFQIEEVDGQIYAMGSDVSDSTRGIFHSSDWGISWQKQYSIPWGGSGIVDFSIPSAAAGYFTTWREVYKSESLISVRAEELADFELYPNPTSERFTVKLQQGVDSEISIYNINGQRVDSQSFDGALFNADVSRLPAGIYFVEIVQDGKRLCHKLLKH